VSTALVIRGIAVDTGSTATPKPVYAAVSGVGVLMSTDNGATWTATTTVAGAWTSVDPFIYSLALVPQPGTLPIVCAGTKGAGLWISSAGTGGLFAPAGGVPGTPDPSVFSVAVDPAANFYCGSQGGQVFRSSNGGATWSAVNGVGATGIPQGPGAFPTENDAVNIYQSEVARTSECKVLDANGDGSLDLVAVDSVHSAFVDDKKPLLTDPTTALLEVLADLPNDFANVTARTKTMVALQKSGVPDFANATYQSCQAAPPAPGVPARVAPLVRVNGQTGGTFSPTFTGIPATDSLGWFPQAVLAGNLDPPPRACSITSVGGIPTVTQSKHGFVANQYVTISGTGTSLDGLQLVSNVIDANTYALNVAYAGGPVSGVASNDGGAASTDLVVVQGVRQASSALLNKDLQGCLVVRQVDPTTKQLGPTVCLDPTDMGQIPTHAAIGDVLSSSRTTAPWSFPAPVGSPDIIVANAVDVDLSIPASPKPTSSLTFYLQHTQAAWTTGGSTPPTYVSVKLLMSQVPLPAGTSVTFPEGDTVGVAIGDLNADGANDFVVVGQLSKTAVVFIYDPSPTAPLSLMPLTNNLIPFRVAAVLTLPAIRAGRPAIGQLTGNGFGTVLVPSFLTNELLEFLASGPVGGTPAFSLVRSACDFQPFDVAAQDLNGDGRADVVACNRLSEDFSVFYQTSPGTLDRAFVPVPTGIAPFLLTSGDVTGSGVPSVVCTMAGENGLWVFGRSPDLGLAPIAKYDLTAVSQLTISNPTQPSIPFVPLIGPTTTGGKNDIVVTMELMNQQTGGITSGLEIIRGEPLGGSVAAILTGTFGPIGYMARPGDVNGDGIPDIVLGEYGTTGSTVFLGQSDGSFLRVPLPGHSLTTVGIADIDGDGFTDIVGADGSGLVVYYGPWAVDPITGKRTIAPPATILSDGPIGQSVSILVSDLDKNGYKDILITGFTADSGGILFQTAPRVFTPVLLTVGGEPAEPEIGDLNGDGLPDIAMTWAKSNVLAVYYQNPHRTSLKDIYLGPITFPTANFPQGCTIIDVDGDGKNDVVVACRGANALNIFYQR
jgi:hypothetical protein